MKKNKNVSKEIIAKIVIAWFLFIAIYYYVYRLPYGLKLTKMDTRYYIHDEGGRTILAEGYNVDINPNYPKVEKIVKYSKNKLGLAIIIKSEDEQLWYVIVKPDSVQYYLPELMVSYTILSPTEYESLDLNDFWKSIR